MICPSTAYDAKGLMKQAIRDDNPVLVFEHKLLYGSKRKEKDAISTIGEVPEDDYTIEFGKAAVRREGKDITIVANLLMNYKALEAAEILENEGISCEVIDPRTLVPFDYETVLDSVKKTGRLMIVHEDNYNADGGAQVGIWFQRMPSLLLMLPISNVSVHIMLPILFTVLEAM